MDKTKILYNTEQLENLFNMGSVYIYGAGKVARTAIKHLAKKQLRVETILVSNRENNPSEIMGIPVKEINRDMQLEYKVIIVCVMEVLQGEIWRKLSDYCCDSIYFIADKLFEEMAYGIADYDIDSLYELKNINKKINELSNLIKGDLLWSNTILWDNEYEKNVIEKNWGRVTEKADFAEKYLKLTRGLELDSIEIINRILNRQNIYLNTAAKKIDLFTDKEKQELKLLEENFSSLIIKLSDELYMYKNYKLPCECFEASVFFYKHGMNKIKDLNAIKGKTIIDVGAFVGDSAVVLSELLPEKIISFEAVPEHCKLFNRTMELNGLDNVEVVNCALGKEQGFIHMNLRGSCSTYVDRKGIDFESKIEVPIISLDQYVSENKVENIALIKVDIEGAEPEFLLGAKETIAKYKPTLLLSIYHNAHDFFELKPMIEAWELGYKFTIYKPTNGNITNETLLIAEVC